MKSIYELETRNQNKKALEIINNNMKIIVVKGVGYICVPKEKNVTADMLRSLANTIDKYPNKEVTPLK